MSKATKTINEILSKLKLQLNRFKPSNREIVFQNVEIYHETDRTILVELDDQSVWLPKADIKMERKKKAATITIPIWLIKKRFPPEKYKHFRKTYLPKD